MKLHPALEAWFDDEGRSPFEFQRRAWDAYRHGRSGLVHAPTGMGKTLAVWLGPLDEYLRETGQPEANGAPISRPPPPSNHARRASAERDAAEPIRVLWITPLRALASDTVQSLLEPVRAMRLPWTVEKRTGDTPQSLRTKQAKRLPTCLVTTPESLSLLLSHADARARLRSVRAIVVDEWHELLSTKRGTQTELCLARLRAWNPPIRTWGLSATLGNLEQALACLAGVPPSEGAPRAHDPVLIPGDVPKQIAVETIMPPDLSRFPWAGHLGIKLADEVIEAIDRAGTTLLFCNTRSQCEIWFAEISRKRPDWLGRVAIHHGSIDRAHRDRVEQALRTGVVPDLSGDPAANATTSLKCVVCTSSLDLGVDFSPVDQVIQVGSPKGVARLIQRAGRSGHAPGKLSRVLCAPAHAFELVEFAAARSAIRAQEIESRIPLTKPLDVLAQHLVTLAVGEGFTREAALAEVRTTNAYRELSEQEFGWVLEFVTTGGRALGAYPDYQRVRERADDPSGETRYRIATPKLARAHRMSIGTITADAAVVVKYPSGKVLGTIEESFLAKINPGDRFVFSGRVVELLRLRDSTAFVKRSNNRRGIVPTWQGGKTPLSTLLARRVRAKLDASPSNGDPCEDPELRAIAPLMDVQRAWSKLPEPGELLIEHHHTRDGQHTMLFPFGGRLVHEGLGALLAHRIAAHRPITLNVTSNDYGVELASPTPMDPHELDWPALLTTEGLLDDLLRCLNSNELARRRFRDIARIAGLIHQGMPGAGKSARQLQASSELFFDVFLEFDPQNLLLDQARREVLEEQLEIRRLREVLARLGGERVTILTPPRLTPLAFPLWAESLRTQHVTSETWSERIRRMATELEDAAGQAK